MTKAVVRITDNFIGKLSGMANFFDANEAVEFFEHLIDEAFGIIIPNLETFPEMGMDFFGRPSYSLDALAKRQKLMKYVDLGFGRNIFTVIICNCSPGFEINPTSTPLFAWFVAGVGANLFARFPLRSAPFANKFAPTPRNPTPGEQLPK